MPYKYGKPLNDSPFQHYSNGLEFVAERCDFSTGVYVIVPDGQMLQDEALMSSVAGMIGYHATNIHPQLSHFSGYDAIKFCAISDLDSKTVKAQFGLS